MTQHPKKITKHPLIHYITILALIVTLGITACGQTPSPDAQQTTAIATETTTSSTTNTTETSETAQNTQTAQNTENDSQSAGPENKSAAQNQENTDTPNSPALNTEQPTFQAADIPAYSGDAYVAVNNNVPYFTPEEMSASSYETYGVLDDLGRCTTCVASVGKDLMPTEARGNIGSVKPTGWHTVKYDFVDGKYLYNRCHLIGYQLTAENANEKNLITGTRYLNIEGMLPFENMVADYVKETGNHVMYRVTPIFSGDNLLADGVLMEGKSVEDDGDGVLFCVFAYNVQPGVIIDYATGDSSADANYDSGKKQNSQESQGTQSSENTQSTGNTQESQNAQGSENTQNTGNTQESQDTQNSENTQGSQDTQTATYIMNTNTHKFHKPGCRSVKTIKEENYAEFTGSREELIASGYEPCKNCNP